jgi:two-component system C4-dicarboxylate transport sensor histidine kinase DctB
MSDRDDGPWRAGHLAEVGLLTTSLLHELRQPLFAVKALVEMELAGSPQGRERLVTALEQVRHMEELLSWYGGLGRSDEPSTPIELGAASREVAAMLAHKAKAVRGRLDVAVGDAQGVWVVVRPSGLRQVLVNLVSNALDAIEAGGVVTLRVGREGSRGVVDVIDGGHGIPGEVADRVFDAWFTTRAPGRGTGLGLPIARRVAQEAGGDVTLVRTGPEGTTMRVALPEVARGPRGP